MNRGEVLDRAREIVTTDRQATHGNPEDTFGLIADFWTAYLTRTHGLQSAIVAHDVAAMLALLKIARAGGNPSHADSWIDLAGYAACGAELAG